MSTYQEDSHVFKLPMEGLDAMEKRTDAARFLARFPLIDRLVRSANADEVGKYLLQLGVLFVVYVITARIGFGVYHIGELGALAWLPAGVSITALFLYGSRLWPAIALGSIVAHLFVGDSLFVTASIATGNTLQAFAGWYLLRRYIKFDPLLGRLYDSFGLILTGIIVAVISPSIGVTALWVSHHLALVDISTLWINGWLSNAVSILVFTPFLTRWLARPLFVKTRVEILEGLAIFSSLTLISAIVFWTSYSQIGAFPLVYILFIPLVSAALRTGPRGMTLAIAIVSMIAAGSVLFAHAPFTQ